MSLSVPDIQMMLINFQENFPGIYQLIRAFCFLSGMLFVMRGVHYLKVYGEMRMMMASHANIKEPLVNFLVGTVFLYLPTATDVFLQTMYNSTQITLLQGSDFDYPKYQAGMQAVVAMIQLVGYISFVRGWFIISKTAHQGGAAHGATASKGLVHIIGGILAMNVVETKRIIWASLGFT